MKDDGGAEYKVGADASDYINYVYYAVSANCTKRQLISIADTLLRKN